MFSPSSRHISKKIWKVRFSRKWKSYSFFSLWKRPKSQRSNRIILWFLLQSQNETSIEKDISRNLWVSKKRLSRKHGSSQQRLFAFTTGHNFSCLSSIWPKARNVEVPDPTECNNTTSVLRYVTPRIYYWDVVLRTWTASQDPKSVP